MSGTRPQSTPSTASTLTAVLDTTIRSVEQTVRERVDADLPPRPETVCAETWQLVHLLGALSELAATAAPQVGSYPQRYPLHVDDGSDPDRLVAHACRELAALRHALDESSGSTDRDEGR
jgi:hypothetical protein